MLSIFLTIFTDNWKCMPLELARRLIPLLFGCFFIIFHALRIIHLTMVCNRSVWERRMQYAPTFAVALPISINGICPGLMTDY